MIAIRPIVRSLAVVAAAAAILPLASPALAQTSSVPAEPVATPDPGLTGDTVTVGVAGAYLPDYEGSDDYRLVPAPAAIGSFRGFSFQLLGNRLSVDVIPNDPQSTLDLQLGPVGVVNFSRTNRDNIDDARVAVLPERDTSIELGGYVGVGKTGVITSPYDKLSVSLSYRHDVSKVHSSGIFTPSINYLAPLSRRTAVALFASAERAERGFARAYFDVAPAEAVASGLPAFRTRGGWKNYTLGLAATQALTGDLLHGFKLVAGGTYKRMLNDFGDSPLVSVAGSRDQWLGAVGLAYTF